MVDWFYVDRHVVLDLEFVEMWNVEMMSLDL